MLSLGFQIGALLWLLNMASTFFVLPPIFPLLWEMRMKDQTPAIVFEHFCNENKKKKTPNQKNQNRSINIYIWNRSIIEGYLRMRFYNLHLNQRRMCTMFLSLLLSWVILWNNDWSARLCSVVMFFNSNIGNQKYKTMECHFENID